MSIKNVIIILVFSLFPLISMASPLPEADSVSAKKYKRVLLVLNEDGNWEVFNPKTAMKDRTEASSTWTSWLNSLAWTAGIAVTLLSLYYGNSNSKALDQVQRLNAENQYLAENLADHANILENMHQAVSHLLGQ